MYSSPFFVRLFILMVIAFYPLFCFGRNGKEGDSIDVEMQGLLTSDTEVLVNGRVVLFGSVLTDCKGDSVKAISKCEPITHRGSYLSKTRRYLESVYNNMRPDRIMFLIGILSVFGVYFFHKEVRGFIVVVLWICLCVYLIARWILCGFFPVCGLYDTLWNVSWLTVTILLIFKSQLEKRTVAATLLLVDVMMWYALFTDSHPALRTPNPSLDSVWLYIHVPLIIASYSLFIFSTLYSIFGKSVRALNFSLILGEILLGTGIISGSLWAQTAWGSWWSWDPKETSALVTFMVYLTIILFFPALKATPSRVKLWRILVAVAFVSVAFTWLFVATGRHSY